MLAFDLELTYSGGRETVPVRRSNLVPNRGLFLLTLDPALGRLTRVGLELSAAEGTVAVSVCSDPYAPRTADYDSTARAARAS